MEELGFYDFHNDFSINITTAENRTVSVMSHEMTHMITTLTSSYGDFLTLIERGCELYPKYNYIKNFFSKHMLKMQESISTFTELSLAYANGGLQELNRSICNLKYDSPKYYRYVFPLLFIFSFINPEYLPHKQRNFIIPFDIAINMITNIAVNSLNIDLTELYDEEILKNKKALYKTATNNDYSSFFPNRRFYKAIHKLAVQLNEISDTPFSQEKLKEILQTVYKSVLNIEFEEQYDLDYYLQKNKLLILNLFKEAPNYFIIYQNIISIDVKEIDKERLPAYSIPSSPFKLYKYHEALLLSPSEINTINSDMFFIFGDNDTMHESIKKSARAIDYLRNTPIENRSSVNIDMIPNLMSMFRLRSKYILTQSYDYKNKIIYNACIKSKDIIRLKNNNPLVINYKYYDKFRKINIPNRNFYYYCDRTYQNAIEVINNIGISNSLSYSFLQYDGSLSLLIIIIKSNQFLFTPIITPIINLILNDINNQVLKIDFKRFVSLDQNVINDFDVIINCLYHTNSEKNSS